MALSLKAAGGGGYYQHETFPWEHYQHEREIANFLFTFPSRPTCDKGEN